MKKIPFHSYNLASIFFFICCTEIACNMRDSQYVHLPPSDYFYKVYQGKIGENLDFMMQLNRHDSILEGSYYYNKVRKPISLTGNIDKNGKITLIETVAGKETGRFKGSFKVGNQEEISGEWEMKGKRIAFEMQENYDKGTAQLKMENYAQSTGKCNLEADNQKGCAKIRLNHIQIIENVSNSVKEKVNDKLNLIAFDGKKPENITQDFLAQYQKDLQELSPEFALVYEQTLDMNVLLNEANLLTIQCTHYEYMGGAHGSTNHAFVNFDLNTGEEIVLESMFLPNSMEKITEIGAILFREQNNIFENQTFENAGYWFTDDKFYLPKKYYFLKDKIVFQYEEYEIAPYAMGAQIVEIPYIMIEKFIVNNSILANFLKH